MTSLKHIQQEAAAVLAGREEFPAGTVTRAYKPKDLASEINKALDKMNLSLAALPPKPLEAFDAGGEKVIFFPRVEQVIRVAWNPLMLEGDFDGTDARDATMAILQGWKADDPRMEEAFRLAKTPVRQFDFPGQQVIDVIFNYAAYL